MPTAKELLSYTDTVLRVALNRMLVDTATLSRLVQVTATLYRKGAPVNGEPSNNIILVIFEILSDGLRLKARVASGTLNSMLQTVMSTTINGSTTPALSHPNLFLGLAAPGAYFLYNHAWADVRTDNDFQASLTVAKMLLQISNLDPRVLVDYGAEVSRVGRKNHNLTILLVLENWTAEHLSTCLEYPPPGYTARFIGR